MGNAIQTDLSSSDEDLGESFPVFDFGRYDHNQNSRRAGAKKLSHPGIDLDSGMVHLPTGRITVVPLPETWSREILPVTT